MEKLESSSYRGIEYIQLKELPDEQYLTFMKWVSRESIITIQVNGNTLNNCVQYSDYSFWFDNVLNGSEGTTANGKSTRKGNSYGLAFDN